MQSVTAQLKSTLESSPLVYSRKVELYRQVWGGSAYTYDTAIDITDEVLDAGRIMWKLDKEGFNQWTMDNTTITVRNDRQQWKQDNPKGYFPSGYLLNNSKIKIYVGAQLADGTFERPQIFTGYITGDAIKDSREKNAVITIAGSMTFFSKFNAEDISTAVTNELLGSASGDTFNTAQDGVAAVSLVVKRGLTAGGAGAADIIKPSVDYTTTNTDTKATPATITLNVALTATESLWVSYRYWYTDKTLEWLVEEIMTLCGISDYTIQPAVFETNIPTTWTQTSQADWESDTLTNIGTRYLSGSFYQRWFAQVGTLMPSSPTAQTVRFLGTFTSTGSGDGYIAVRRDNIYTPTRYYALKARLAPDEIHLAVLDQLGDWVFDLGKVTDWPSAGAHEYMVEYNNSTTEFKVYMDGVLKLTVTDTFGTPAIDYPAISYSSSGGMTVTASGYYGARDLCGDTTFDGSSSPVLESVVNDMGASLVSIGTLAVTANMNGGSIVVSTYTSGTSDFSSDNDPAGWVELSNTGLVLSAVKRYIKFKVAITSSGFNSPTIDNITLTYYTNSTTISLVNLTGMTCLDALDSVSQKCNYERGFNATGKFIFQPRSTTLPAVLTLSSATNTFWLQAIVDGVDRVYNHIIAQIGEYTSVSSAEDDTEPNSITKYNKRIYTVPSDSLLPPANANLAYATTPTILAYSKNPRRRCQAVMSLNTYLELGDKVTLYFDEPTAFRRWKWGDTDVTYGQADLEYYTDDTDIAERVGFWGVSMRIEGIEIYWHGNERKTILDLVEVI